MTTTPSSPAVELLDARHVHFVETAPPPLTAAQTAAMNRRWEAMTGDNPSLFDGPVVVCTGVERKDPQTLVLSWCRATYRLLTLRLDAEHAVPAPSVFVTVAQPTTDGALLVGRMADSTVASGRWQLPGGTIEPPTATARLDQEASARHAARELAEEVGLTVAHEELTLWAVTRGNWGNFGLHFRSPAQPITTLEDAHLSLTTRSRAQGLIPELDRISFIRSQADLAGLGGPTADFMPALAALHSRYGQSGIGG
ncbi:NUDIX hydrolase [Streptomyces sp. A1136]|uniref:NUDIX hydrolase n=1 Tax=Streptomyces sp. A1136 TaxID=2563102 RepID=UPI001F0D09B6|nr:NUDIX domain-containing protein [Streptomyces sp. A1136]